MSTGHWWKPLVFCALALPIAANAQKQEKRKPKPPPAEARQKAGSTAPDSYVPVRSGSSWKYRVEFPEDVSLLYYPGFDRPEGLVSASIFSGLGAWSKGPIEFDVAVKDVLVDSADSVLANLTVSDSAHKLFFYFDLTDSAKKQAVHQLRSTSKAGESGLDILYIFGAGDPPAFQIVRPLVRLAPADRQTPYDISVPAGAFKNCLKSTVTINAVGGRIETFESYLAPNVGVVKAVGKSPDGKVLYTMELQQFIAGKR